MAGERTVQQPLANAALERPAIVVERTPLDVIPNQTVGVGTLLAVRDAV